MDASETKAAQHVEVGITKKADDPLGVVRVSIGGVRETGGYYCVYRGSKESVIEAMEHALRAMRLAAEYLGPGKEPEVQPDGGKRYA